MFKGMGRPSNRILMAGLCLVILAVIAGGISIPLYIRHLSQKEESEQKAKIQAKIDSFSSTVSEMEKSDWKIEDLDALAKVYEEICAECLKISNFPECTSFITRNGLADKLTSLKPRAKSLFLDPTTTPDILEKLMGFGLVETGWIPDLKSEPNVDLTSLKKDFESKVHFLEQSLGTMEKSVKGLEQLLDAKEKIITGLDQNLKRFDQSLKDGEKNLNALDQSLKDGEKNLNALLEQNLNALDQSLKEKLNAKDQSLKEKLNALDQSKGRRKKSKCLRSKPKGRRKKSKCLIRTKSKCLRSKPKGKAKCLRSKPKGRRKKPKGKAKCLRSKPKGRRKKPKGKSKCLRSKPKGKAKCLDQSLKDGEKSLKAEEQNLESKGHEIETLKKKNNDLVTEKSIQQSNLDTYKLRDSMDQ